MLRRISVSGARPASRFLTMRKLFRRYQDIDIVFTMGQSQWGGGHPKSEFSENQWDANVGKQIPGAYCWSKSETPDAYRAGLEDDYGWRHRFMPLTTGFGGGANPFYPWRMNKENLLYAGPEMNFAWTIRKKRKSGKLLIVKLAIGGSQMADRESPVPDWNFASPEAESYAKIYLRYYVYPAMMEALKLAGGDPSRVNVLGGVSMIGISDTRSAADTAAYQSNMENFITAMREAINPNMGWVVIKSPLTLDAAPPGGNPLPLIEDIRTAQTNIGTSLPNVEVIDSEGLQYADGHTDLLHLPADGYNTLGGMAADALLLLNPVTLEEVFS